MAKGACVHHEARRDAKCPDNDTLVHQSDRFPTIAYRNTTLHNCQFAIHVVVSHVPKPEHLILSEPTPLFENVLVLISPRWHQL